MPASHALAVGRESRGWETIAIPVAALAIAAFTLLPNARWALGVCALPLFLAVLLVRPTWGLYVLLLVITVVPTGGVIHTHDYHIAPVDLYVMLFTLLWASHKAIAQPSIRISPLLVPIVIIVLVRFASVFVTPRLIGGSFISFLRYVEWLLVFLIVTDLARGRVVNLLKVFLVVIGLQTVLSIGQLSLSLIRGDIVTRGGTLGQTGMLLAWLQIYAFLLGLSLSHRETASGKRVAWWSYTALLGVGLISTLTRSAWITAVVGVFLYQWLDCSASVSSKVTRVTRDTLTALLALVALFFLNRLLVGVIVLRAATFAALGETYAWLERLTLWRVGLNMFAQHPILGVGTGNYVDMLGQLVGAEEARTTHNAVIAILSETGILGLVAYLFFVTRVVAMVRSDLRKYGGSSLYPLLLPLGAAVVAQLFADWISWTSFFVWSMFFLGLYVALRAEVIKSTTDQRTPAERVLPGAHG